MDLENCFNNSSSSLGEAQQSVNDYTRVYEWEIRTDLGQVEAGINQWEIKLVYDSIASRDISFIDTATSLTNLYTIVIDIYWYILAITPAGPMIAVVIPPPVPPSVGASVLA